MKDQKIKPNIEEAAKFLQALCNGKKGKFLFMPCYVEADGKTKQIETKLGTFEQLSDYLIERNKRGYEIFFAVNRTDNSGRRTKQNITGLRSLFVDSDEGPIKDFPIDLW